MKKKLLFCSVIFSLILNAGFAYADNSNNSNNYITINNIIPRYSSGYGNYGGNIMCTDRGGFCANSNYIMSSRRTYYAPAQWKRLTLRERRLSAGTERSNYYGY